MSGMSWVTMGRTIENYLPVQSVSSVYGNDRIPVISQYQGFAEYLDGIIDGEGRKFLRNKVLFARGVMSHITREGMELSFDLGARVSEAAERISFWNGLAPHDSKT
jgi:putative ATP-dependent endonuclease of OLD family